MRLKKFLVRHPVSGYFCITFLVSWGGAMALVAPYLINGEPIPRMFGLFMFPVMLLGPSLTAIFLTRLIDGKSGLKDLYSRMKRGRIGAKWYLIAIGLPPVAILIVLNFMGHLISPVFDPHLFVIGLSFGLLAGYLEEIGWTGYAYPRMNLSHDVFWNSIILGIIWCFWHIPVIDYLGSASPHGKYLLLYFFSFVSVMVPLRSLIAWIYRNTHSVLLAQIMHASSTGFLVMLSPTPISPSREPIWYFVYGGVLWIITIAIRIIELHKSGNKGGSSGSANQKLQNPFLL